VRKRGRGPPTPAGTEPKERRHEQQDRDDANRIVDAVGKAIAVFGAEGARASSSFTVDLTPLFDL